MAETNTMPRLRQQYDSVIRQQLQEKFNYKNPMQVPALEKIVLNIGVGEAVADSRVTRR